MFIVSQFRGSSQRLCRDIPSAQRHRSPSKEPRSRAVLLRRSPGANPAQSARSSLPRVFRARRPHRTRMDGQDLAEPPAFPSTANRQHRDHYFYYDYFLIYCNGGHPHISAVPPLTPETRAKHPNSHTWSSGLEREHQGVNARQRS